MLEFSDFQKNNNIQDITEFVGSIILISYFIKRPDS